mmetsp:Transcript_139283/g.444525  ORF Transcript_139283/g.444525 Transcript_139283/m.444525 type:complete len:244 (-) Transcript_139283:944-1675(-)
MWPSRCRALRPWTDTCSKGRGRCLSSSTTAGSATWCASGRKTRRTCGFSLAMTTPCGTVAARLPFAPPLRPCGGECNNMCRRFARVSTCAHGRQAAPSSRQRMCLRLSMTWSRVLASSCRSMWICACASPHSVPSSRSTARRSSATASPPLASAPSCGTPGGASPSASRPRRRGMILSRRKTFSIQTRRQGRSRCSCPRAKDQNMNRIGCTCTTRPRILTSVALGLVRGSGSCGPTMSGTWQT